MTNIAKALINVDTSGHTPGTWLGVRSPGTRQEAALATMEASWCSWPWCRYTASSLAACSTPTSGNQPLLGTQTFELEYLNLNLR